MKIVIQYNPNVWNSTLWTSSKLFNKNRGVISVRAGFRFPDENNHPVVGIAGRNCWKIGFNSFLNKDC
jgi:hypothetical protein